MATFYTSYNQEYAPGVRAAITYTLTQDIANNASILKFEPVAEFRSSGNYYRNGAKVSVAAAGKTIESATKSIGIGSYSSYGLNFKFATDTITIKHNDDGTKNGVVITATLDIQGTKNTGSITIDLPQIPRGNKYSIDKTMLTKDTSVVLTATKIIDTYTSTIEWTNGVMSGQIAGKSPATEWSISYATLAAGIPAGMTRLASIICTTYNGDTEVMTTILQIAINTGSIVMSLYDDGNGNRGVTFGERASGEGLNVVGIPVDFSKATNIKFTEETGAVVSRSSGATLMNYEVHKVGNVVNAQMRFRTTAATNAGSDLFVGTIDKWLPIVEPVGMTTYFGSSAIICTIWKDGTIRCRVVGAQVYATAEVQCAISYITNE